MARNLLQLALFCALVLLLPTLYLLHSSRPSSASPDIEHLDFDHAAPLHGSVIMPKLENATAKAELGRASWKVRSSPYALFSYALDSDDVCSSYILWLPAILKNQHQNNERPTIPSCTSSVGYIPAANAHKSFKSSYAGSHRRRARGRRRHWYV